MFAMLQHLACHRSDDSRAETWQGEETVIHRYESGKTSLFQSPFIANGDWLFTAKEGTLIVSSGALDVGMGREPGEIVGFVRDGQFSDNLSSFELEVVLENKKTMWQTVAIRPQKIWSHSPRKNVAELGLSIVKVSTNNRLLLKSFVTYVPRYRSFKIWSRVQNISGAPLDHLKIGTQLFWDGGFAFAPGLGYIERVTSGNTAWIALKDRTHTTAVICRNRPYAVDFAFDPHGPYENHAQIAKISLAAGESFEFEQHIVVARGGLGAIAPVAWQIAGKRYGIIKGNIAPMQSWAEIEVRDRTDASILNVAVSPEGYFEAAVPMGDYTVSLVTPGGRQGKSVAVTETPMDREISFSTVLPGTVHYLITDDNYMSLPARLVIRGIPPTPDPILGPRHMASGAENVVYSASGAGAFELPEGRYEILATHGPEYSLGQRDLQVVSERPVSAPFQLTQEVNKGDWRSADLHLHAEPSPDSDVSLTDRIISLFAENVDIAVATDHNTVTDYGIPLHQRPFPQIHHLETESGVEITTKKPRWGHFNVFPWPAGEPAPPFMEQTPESIFSFVRTHHPNAIIQVNHPRMDYHHIGYFTIARLNLMENRFDIPGASFDFDTIEIFNGMDLKHPEIVKQNLEEWFALLNQGHRFVATGNSDSHFLVGHFAGYPRNYVYLPDEASIQAPVSALADALLAGKSFVSNGPFLTASIGDATFGDEIMVDSHSETVVHIEVQSPSWLPVDVVEIVVNGQSKGIIPLELPDDARVQSLDVPIEFTEDAWVVIKVSGTAKMNHILPGIDASPLAFSNPIRVRLK
ncbi:MAG: CehA/McbA family metallohydrolase [Deltaproteobacteria bacterium]|nr:CehA/McbA family metallohydrolase [Deltaproteobacteria bacterium]